jgi:hypothetical protein
MAAPWTNPDGLQVEFGNYWSDPKNFVNRARSVSTAGEVRQIVIDYDLRRIDAGTTYFPADLNNDGTNDGFSDKDVRLPANASVLRVTMVAKTAAVGGTSWTLGTYQRDGTVISATSLITATEGVTANQNAVGKRLYGNGALVATTAGTAGVGTVPAFLALSVVGTFTGGTGKIVIEYVEPLPDVTV